MIYTIKCHGGLYSKALQIHLYGLCSKLACLSMPVKVTDNN
jgi:hypothetical protein